MSGAWEVGRLRIAWGSIPGAESPVERTPRRWLSCCQRRAQRRCSSLPSRRRLPPSFVAHGLRRATCRRPTVNSALGCPGANGPELPALHGPYDACRAHSQFPPALQHHAVSGHAAPGEAFTSPVSLELLRRLGPTPELLDEHERGSRATATGRISASTVARTKQRVRRHAKRRRYVVRDFHVRRMP